MDPLIALLPSLGLPGLVIAALLYALRSKDQELTAERQASVARAEKYSSFALECQQRTLAAVEKSADIAEACAKAIEELRRGRR